MMVWQVHYGIDIWQQYADEVVDLLDGERMSDFHCRHMEVVERHEPEV